MRSRSEVRRNFSGSSIAPGENAAVTQSEPSTPIAVDDQQHAAQRTGDARDEGLEFGVRDACA
jgi:hypothetical protein